MSGKCDEVLGYHSLHRNRVEINSGVCYVFVFWGRKVFLAAAAAALHPNTTPPTQVYVRISSFRQCFWPLLGGGVSFVTCQCWVSVVVHLL